MDSKMKSLSRLLIVASCLWLHTPTCNRGTPPEPMSIVEASALADVIVEGRIVKYEKTYIRKSAFFITVFIEPLMTYKGHPEASDISIPGAEPDKEHRVSTIQVSFYAGVNFGEFWDNYATDDDEVELSEHRIYFLKRFPHKQPPSLAPLMKILPEKAPELKKILHRGSR